MSATIDEIIRLLAERLSAVATPERAEYEKSYLKSDLEHLGATVPDARAASKWLLAEYPRLRAEPWPLVQACWDSGIYELRSTMGFYLERANLGRKGLERLESLCRRCHTWALIDQIAVHVVPRAKPPHSILTRWAVDDDFWIRRVALLCNLKELRAGRGRPDTWVHLAVPNLQHPEVFIRKAIGWVLREIGKKRPDWTADFIEDHRHHMAPLSIQEANRHLGAATDDFGIAGLSTSAENADNSHTKAQE